VHKVTAVAQLAEGQRTVAAVNIVTGGCELSEGTAECWKLHMLAVRMIQGVAFVDRTTRRRADDIVPAY